MRDHLRRGYAHDFVIPFKCPTELDHHSFQDQITYLRQFCVQNSDQSRVHMCEIWRCHLSLDDRFSQQTLSSQNVLVEQLNYDVLDVGYVYLVYYSVDTLSQ